MIVTALVASGHARLLEEEVRDRQPTCPLPADVSLGDIAVKGSEELASEALEGISHPAEPDRPDPAAAGGATDGALETRQPLRRPG